MANDIYCESILPGKLKIQIEKETEHILVFHHTQPSFPLHIVAIPKAHVLNLVDVAPVVIQEIFAAFADIIKDRKLAEKNYRVVTNGGDFQESKHLHFHLISTG